MNTIVYIALSILFFGCTFACGHRNGCIYIEIVGVIIIEFI